MVEQAAQAVAGISADALAEVRSLRAPPAPVRDVLEGVLRLMGIRDTSWNSMKTFLAKRGIKDEIRYRQLKDDNSSVVVKQDTLCHMFSFSRHWFLKFLVSMLFYGCGCFTG